MFYGIISHLDGETTRVFFKNKRVQDANVVYSTQLSALVKMLKAGDVVYVVGVNRFASVSQFMVFGKFCMANGVSLRLLAQPCLDISNGRHWKPIYLAQMAHMVDIEQRAIDNMTKGFQMTNEQWEYVYHCFRVMNLEILAHTFSMDGVLKRGS